MPAITATVHQVLRYFFVGAIAATFVAVPPGEDWSRRFLYFLDDAKKPGFVVAMVIAGSLIYGVHRVVFYPWISRCIIRYVIGPEPTWRVNPYGKVLAREMEFENRAVRLSVRQRERFAGWASENHVYYCAIEIAAFTRFIWPGWRLSDPYSWLFGLGLFPLFFFVCLWDVHAFSVIFGLEPEAPSGGA